MSELEAVTPSHDDEEIVGEPLVTSRQVDSELDMTSFIQVKYMDDEVVFYKNVNTRRETHGQEAREIWDEDVGSGYYKFADSEKTEEVMDAQKNGRLEDLLEVKGVGDSGIEELRNNGYQNVREVVEESKSNLIDVPKIGRKSAQRIMENFADQYDVDYEDSSDGGSRVKSITKTQSNESREKTKSNSSSDDSNSSNSSDNDDSNDDSDDGSSDDGWESLVESDEDDWTMNKL